VRAFGRVAGLGDRGLVGGTRLGAPVASPNPARLKAPHNYVGRIIATILTCGIYGLWWQYDLMTEGNRHFQENWAWEDGLAASVQRLIAA